MYFIDGDQLIPVRSTHIVIHNYVHIKQLDSITYTYLNLNGSLIQTIFRLMHVCLIPPRRNLYGVIAYPRTLISFTNKKVVFV